MLELHRSVVLLVDVQGRLASLVEDSAGMLARQRLLLEAASVLSLPVIWAEQLPDKLGPTVAQLSEVLTDTAPIAKDAFGCLGEPRLREALRATGRDQVVVAGIETHVCVWQSVRQLLDANYSVYPLVDAIRARRAQDNAVGLERMREAGAALITVEMALFEWMQHARHPAFRTISGLLKQADHATS